MEQVETAEYLAEMTRELAYLAGRGELPIVRLLLQLATMELEARLAQLVEAKLSRENPKEKNRAGRK